MTTMFFNILQWDNLCLYRCKANLYVVNNSFFCTFWVKINTHGNLPYARTHFPIFHFPLTFPDLLNSPTFTGFPGEWPHYNLQLDHYMKVVTSLSVLVFLFIIYLTASSSALPKGTKINQKTAGLGLKPKFLNPDDTWQNGGSTMYWVLYKFSLSSCYTKSSTK